MKRVKRNPMQAPELPQSKLATVKPKVQAPDLRPPVKANPSYKYFLRVQKPGGKVMTWNGDRFTDNEPFSTFSTARSAKVIGKRLAKKFPILIGYKIWVDAKFHTPTHVGKKGRAMRGGSKSNPSPRINKELDEAAKKLEDFSGHRVAHLESAYSRSSQSTGLIVGEVDLIGYTAKRDGRVERYGHKFRKNSRPLLAVTSDGKQLHIVGGQYEFTEAGIEDR